MTAEYAEKESEDSFLFLVYKDLEFIMQNTDKLQELGCPRQYPERWCNFLRDYPFEFKEICKKVAKSCVDYVPAECRQLIKDKECPICGKMLAENQYSQHMFIEHGQHNEVRCRVGTTHCLVCMKQFWDRDRLISHLTNASKEHCGRFYLQDREPLPAEEIQELDKAAAAHARTLKKKGFAKTKQTVTFCKMCGPILPRYAKARPAYWDRGRRQQDAQNAEPVDVQDVLDA